MEPSNDAAKFTIPRGTRIVGIDGIAMTYGHVDMDGALWSTLTGAQDQRVIGWIKTPELDKLISEGLLGMEHWSLYD
jgi:hypothetical protein